LLGGGALVTTTTGNGKAAIQDSEPNASNNGWTATGTIVLAPGAGATASVRAFAICTT
jgi:hypothetical protein